MNMSGSESSESTTVPSTPPSLESRVPQSILDYGQRFTTPSPRPHHYSHSNSRRTTRLRDSGSRGRRRARHQEDDEEDSYSPKENNRRRSSTGGAPGSLLSCASWIFSAVWRVLRSERFAGLVSLAFRHKRLVIPALLLFYCFMHVNVVTFLRVTFGSHPIEGGRLGQKLDRIMVRRVMSQTFREKQLELYDLGIRLPKVRLDPKRKLDIDTMAADRELLIQRESRSRTLSILHYAAEDFPSNCAPPNGQTESSLLSNSFFDSSMSSTCRIPPAIFVPSVVSWNPQRPGKVTTYETLMFDEIEMRDLVEDIMPELLETFDSIEATIDKVHLWALCAVYFYGGVFVGDRLSIQQEAVEELLKDENGFLESTQHRSPVALSVFENSTQQKGERVLTMLAATPRHPLLHCVLNSLSGNKRVANQIYEGLKLRTSGKIVSTRWNKISTSCGYHGDAVENCCQAPRKLVVTDDLPTSEKLATVARQMGSQPHGYLYLKLLGFATEKASGDTAVTTVDIQFDTQAKNAVMRPKITLESKLKKKRVDPGWLCMRCLKSPLFGSLSECSGVCPVGYEYLMCRTGDTPAKTDVTLDVTIKDASKETDKLIPRIIHQTFFEDLSLDRYPHLTRLQNSWKAAGWEYRFYNDASAKEYIEKNFPPRFVEAFDALIPGAYKADLFRYLVLMKDGGVYADIDVLLDTTLDTLVTPSMSFFAARDLVGDYAGEPFCLWNGLVGAKPGHPFIVRTVERLVNLIVDRADVYDMERDICRQTEQPVEVWKIREEPLLLFSGPCALGVGANEAMNRTSLHSFDLGWLGLEDLDFGGKKDHGDALILLGDKHDMGAFRISDPVRNIVVASTELQGLQKHARITVNPTEGEKRREKLRQRPKAHYSTAGAGSYVWGSKDVYKDDLVANERLKFNVQYDRS